MKKLYIDIGGTYLRSELHNNTETIFETLSSKKDKLLAYIEKKMREYPEIDFIGIAYAGQVYNGRILSAPNILIDEKEIKQKVESYYDVRLEIDNDLKCAVMAEAEYFKSDSIAALYVGTGLGAASIDGGKIVRGSRNLANEIGHIPYREAPFSCGCEKKNCIELFASGSGISKWLDYYDSTQISNLQRFRDSTVKYERAIAETFESALLYATATLVTVANPEYLVLGGGIIKRNPYLVEILKERLEEFALKSSMQTLKIEISRLDNAPLIGAKLLQKRKYG